MWPVGTSVSNQAARAGAHRELTDTDRMENTDPVLKTFPYSHSVLCRKESPYTLDIYHSTVSDGVDFRLTGTSLNKIRKS